MASKSVFQSLFGMVAPTTNAVNEAGGSAYEFSAEHQLAQYAATGCLNNTFYGSAERTSSTSGASVTMEFSVFS